MAKNLYKSAFAIGSSQGKYGASMYDVASSENKIKLEDMRFQFEQESFDKNMGLGLGEYKFGDEIIAAKDIAVKSSEVKYKNMFDEAVSNFDYKSKVNKVQMLEEDMVSDQKLKVLDFEKDSNKDSNTINFNNNLLGNMSFLK